MLTEILEQLDELDEDTDASHKLILYADGSGRVINESERALFDFDDIDELQEKLTQRTKVHGLTNSEKLDKILAKLEEMA